MYEDDASALLRWFARRTLSAECAVDLVGETFVAAWEARAQVRGRTAAQRRAWLFAIAKHRLADFQRRGAAERSAFARIAFEGRQLTAEEFERIEDLMSLERLATAVRTQFARLSAEDQEILTLRIVQEHDYAEIAAALSINEAAARARTSRALGRLRRDGNFRYEEEGLNV